MSLGKYGTLGWTSFPTSQTTASTNLGVSTTPGISSAWGSWVRLWETSPDVHAIQLLISGGSTTAVAKNHQIEIGYDPANGSSYSAVITGLLCGQSQTGIAGLHHYFPLYVKGGGSWGVRSMGSHYTAGTLRVQADAFSVPTGMNNSFFRSGTYTETIGSIASTVGVSVTPGNSNAWGSWASLGTTVKDLWFFQLCVQCNNATTTAMAYEWQLAYGDATNKEIIIFNYMLTLPGTAEITQGRLNLQGYRNVPAGSNLYVRGKTSGTAVTGWNCVAIGCGG